MASKSDNDQKELTLEALIENLEHKYSHIVPTSDKLDLIAEPTPGRVCAGIKAGSSAQRKVNSRMERDMFFKYNGEWYKWCPNCNQYHKVLCFNRHRGYEAHENFHNVCFATTRIMNLTNNKAKPMSVDDIIARWGQLREDVMKPIKHYEGETAIRKKKSDKKGSRTSKAIITEIRHGLDVSVGELASNTSMVGLHESVVPEVDEQPTNVLEATPVLKPVTETVVSAVPVSEFPVSSDDSTLIALGADLYNRVVRLMTRRAGSGQGISEDDFKKLAAVSLVQTSLATRELSLRVQAQILGNASKSNSRKLLKAKQSK